MKYANINLLMEFTMEPKRHPKSKLTLTQIAEIRMLFQRRVPLSHLAAQYHVSQSTIKYHTDFLEKYSVGRLAQMLTREAA